MDIFLYCLDSLLEKNDEDFSEKEENFVDMMMISLITAQLDHYAAMAHAKELVLQ